LNPVLNIDKEGVNQNDLPHLATSKTLGISTQFAETADTKKIIANKINNNGTAIETAAGEVRVKEEPILNETTDIRLVLAEELLQSLDENPEHFRAFLLDHLDNPSLFRESMHALRQVSHNLGKIHSIAMELSYSDDKAVRIRAIEALALADGFSNPEARRRLLDVAWESDVTEELVPILDSISPTLLPPDDKDETTAMLTQVAESTTDPFVKAYAISEFSHWNRDGNSAVATMTRLLSGSSNASVRQAISQGLGRYPNNSSAKSTLLSIAMNPQENPSVRASAIDGLKHANLNFNEYQQLQTVFDSLTFE